MSSFDLAHMWPFLATGLEFFVAYAVLSLIFIGVGALIALVVGDVLDGPVRSVASPTAMSAAGGTSTVVSFAPVALVVGRFPSGDDVFLVAALRGQAHLEAALWAAAYAEGWLRPKADVAVLPDVDARSPHTDAFKRTLEDLAAGVSLRARAQAAAARLAPELRTHAERVGVARSAERRAGLTLLAMSGAVCSVVVGLVRAFVLGDYVAGDAVSGFTLQIGFAALVSLAFTQRHRQARAYLAWLDDAIDAVREDVRAGAGRPSDAVLVAAVDGDAGLGAWRRRLAR